MVNIPAHVWARSEIKPVFELGDIDSKWLHPNVIRYSAEIDTYGNQVSVEGLTLISEQELQTLLGERPENASELKAEPDRTEEQAPLKVTPIKRAEIGREE